MAYSLHSAVSIVVGLRAILIYCPLLAQRVTFDFMHTTAAYLCDYFRINRVGGGNFRTPRSPTNSDCAARGARARSSTIWGDKGSKGALYVHAPLFEIIQIIPRHILGRDKQKR